MKMLADNRANWQCLRKGMWKRAEVPKEKFSVGLLGNRERQVRKAFKH